MPVICLKSGDTLKPAGSGQYELVEPPITAADVAADTSFYGASITNYTTPAGDPNVGWQIFHSDGDNIYLIADDFINLQYSPSGLADSSTNVYNLGRHMSGYSDTYEGSANILDESKTNPEVLKWVSWVSNYPTATWPNVKHTAYLLDTSKWNLYYCNDKFAKYSIGSPTFELFEASYDRMFPNNDITWSFINVHGGEEGFGYNWNWSSLDLSIKPFAFTEKDDVIFFALASPKGNPAVMSVFLTSLRPGDSSTNHGPANGYNSGIRPVICLKSGVILKPAGSGQYELVAP